MYAETGRGALELPERTYNVDYEVRDDMMGKLFGLSPGDLALAMLPDKPVILVFEDHRRAKIAVKNHEGDFEIVGPIVESVTT